MSKNPRIFHVLCQCTECTLGASADSVSVPTVLVHTITAGKKISNLKQIYEMFIHLLDHVEDLLVPVEPDIMVGYCHRLKN